jgi:hypothetical protein
MEMGDMVEAMVMVADSSMSGIEGMSQETLRKAEIKKGAMADT